MKHFDPEAFSATSEQSFAQLYPALAQLGAHRPQLLKDFERILRDLHSMTHRIHFDFIFLQAQVR